MKGDNLVRDFVDTLQIYICKVSTDSLTKLSLFKRTCLLNEAISFRVLKLKVQIVIVGLILNKPKIMAKYPYFLDARLLVNSILNDIHLVG